MLKPINRNIELVYRCPICNDLAWISETQAKYPGFAFECCNQMHQIDTMKSIEVKYNYNTVSYHNHQDSPTNSQSHSDNYKEATKILKQQGFSTDEIHQMLSSIININQLQTSDIIRIALQTFLLSPNLKNDKLS